MSNATHTPGPWSVGSRSFPSFVAGPIGDLIAYCDVSTGKANAEKQANARLIAAAPDLLEALEIMISDFGDYPASERPCRAFDLARAAIAKAKGSESAIGEVAP